MVEAGFVLLAASLVLMLFFTVLTLWYVPKVLRTEGEDDEESERTDGGLANA